MKIFLLAISLLSSAAASAAPMPTAEALQFLDRYQDQTIRKQGITKTPSEVRALEKIANIADDYHNRGPGDSEELALRAIGEQLAILKSLRTDHGQRLNDVTTSLADLRAGLTAGETCCYSKQLEHPSAKEIECEKNGIHFVFETFAQTIYLNKTFEIVLK